MTRKQRAQVVELLRCAADDDGTQKDCPWGLVAAGLDLGYDVHSSVTYRAWHAYDSVRTELVGAYRLELLEAAQCVEEGSYP